MTRSRVVQTLAGPVRYADSNWTEAQWENIRAYMAKCTDPRPGVDPPYTKYTVEEFERRRLLLAQLP